MKILICDDDPVIRYLLDVVLSRRGGHEVITVAHPDAVAPALVEHRPDLLLLDYVLPGRTGLELVRELRANGRFGQLPIVFLTGRVDVAEPSELAELGVRGVVEKPFETATLSDRLVAMTQVPASSR